MKLKPCPFCGGKARLWTRKCDKAGYTIGCNNIECFLWIPDDVKLRNLHYYAPCYVYKEDLIKAWNFRYDKIKQISAKAVPDVIEFVGEKIKFNLKFIKWLKKWNLK